MIYPTLTWKAIVAHQLQNSINNISAQFQLEKASSQPKDTRINSLEDLIIELGHDPKDVKATERVIKKKNYDITSLKKQLKIPPLHHPIVLYNNPPFHTNLYTKSSYEMGPLKKINLVRCVNKMVCTSSQEKSMLKAPM